MLALFKKKKKCWQTFSCRFCLQVRVLFSKGPFISIFASDPHIIIKAINQNLNSVLRDSNINGHDYMRNIIHLPVFLNSRGLSTAKRLCISTPADQLNSGGQYRDVSKGWIPMCILFYFIYHFLHFAIQKCFCMHAYVCICVLLCIVVHCSDFNCCGKYLLILSSASFVVYCV